MNAGGAAAAAPAGAANELAAAGASLTAAGASLTALSAAGGLSAAQLQGLQQSITQAVTFAVTQAMSAQLQPINAQLAQQGAQLAQLAAQQAFLMTLASKTHNVTCGEGGIRPYVPVPNAAGVLAPPGEQPLLNRAALLDLNAARSAAWCAHYGAPVDGTLADRHAHIASALGLAPGIIS